jgi:hypothetical protein
MPGSSENESLILFWIDEKSPLKDFKKAIGSKIVFKYRLQFFPSLEKYHELIRSSREISFTPQEQSMINEMTQLEASKKAYKNSA